MPSLDLGDPEPQGWDAPSFDLPAGGDTTSVPSSPSSGDYAEYSARAAYGEPASPQDPAPPTVTAGQPSYGQQPYGQPPVYPPVPISQLSPADEATWSSAAHWSAILASFAGVGFLGPLLILLIQGPKSARVRQSAVESLNFEITFIISMIASVLLMLVVIGFVTIFVFPIIWLVLRIIAAVNTSGGGDYRYPVNIRLVK